MGLTRREGRSKHPAKLGSIYVEEHCRVHGAILMSGNLGIAGPGAAPVPKRQNP